QVFDREVQSRGFYAANVLQLVVDHAELPAAGPWRQVTEQRIERQHAGVDYIAGVAALDGVVNLQAVVVERGREALHPGQAVCESRAPDDAGGPVVGSFRDRKSTRLNSSHVKISYAVFC